MKKRLNCLFPVLILLLLFAALVSCGGSKVGVRPDEKYEMDEPVPKGAGDAKTVNLTFTPETIVPNQLMLKAGEKVLFVIKNTDPKEDHNFLEPDAGLEEILVHPGQTVRRLWTAPSKAGEYVPSCNIHPWISMTLVVQ